MLLFLDNTNINWKLWNTIFVTRLKCCAPTSYKIFSLPYIDLSLSKQVTVNSANHKKHIHGFNTDHVEVMYVSLKNYEWLQLQFKNQLLPRDKHSPPRLSKQSI